MYVTGMISPEVASILPIQLQLFFLYYESFNDIDIETFSWTHTIEITIIMKLKFICAITIQFIIIIIIIIINKTWTTIGQLKERQ